MAQYLPTIGFALVLIGAMLLITRWQTRQYRQYLARHGDITEGNQALLQKNNALMEANNALLERQVAALERIAAAAETRAE